jgi:hypothetical protein
MPIGPFTQSLGHDLSLALVATSPAAQACVSCFLTAEAGAVVPAVWMDVYKLAYEKARAALVPSRFQVMLQPCMN